MKEYLFTIIVFRILTVHILRAQVSIEMTKTMPFEDSYYKGNVQIKKEYSVNTRRNLENKAIKSWPFRKELSGCVEQEK